jgi:hypothetical protein
MAVGVPHPSYVNDIITHLAPLPTTKGPGILTTTTSATAATTTTSNTVWAAAENRTWEESAISNTVKNGVHFSSVLYPIWPSETVDALSASAAASDGESDSDSEPAAAAAAIAIARASAFLYSNLTCDPSDYPEPPYQTCVDAGWGALTIFSALARVLPGAEGPIPVWMAADAADAEATDATATVEVASMVRDMVDALEDYVAAYGANSTNFLAYAPGGGVENVGLSQAVVDMLVQRPSSNGTIHLFPAWPADEPAAFTTLRVKGALLVSAAWDPVQQAAVNVAVTATVTSPHVTLANPFGKQVTAAAVKCSVGGTLTVRLDGLGRFQWTMNKGEICWVRPH